MPDTPERKLDYGDSIELAWGNIGEDPLWPEKVTAYLFRRDERGQRLIVDQRVYVREEPHDA